MVAMTKMLRDLKHEEAKKKGSEKKSDKEKAKRRIMTKKKRRRKNSDSTQSRTLACDTRHSAARFYWHGVSSAHLHTVRENSFVPGQ